MPVGPLAFSVSLYQNVGKVLVNLQSSIYIDDAKTCVLNNGWMNGYVNKWTIYMCVFVCIIHFISGKENSFADLVMFPAREGMPV